MNKDNQSHRKISKEEAKARGVYEPVAPLSDEYYYHGTSEPQKKAILKGVVGFRDSIGYYGKGFYASRSKKYARRYGDVLVVLEPHDDAYIVHKDSFEDDIDSNPDIVEFNQGIEVLIKNTEKIEVIK